MSAQKLGTQSQFSLFSTLQLKQWTDIIPESTRRFRQEETSYTKSTTNKKIVVYKEKKRLLQSVYIIKTYLGRKDRRELINQNRAKDLWEIVGVKTKRSIPWGFTEENYYLWCWKKRLRICPSFLQEMLLYFDISSWVRSWEKTHNCYDGRCE